MGSALSRCSSFTFFVSSSRESTHTERVAQNGNAIRMLNHEPVRFYLHIFSASGKSPMGRRYYRQRGRETRRWTISLVNSKSTSCPPRCQINHCELRKNSLAYSYYFNTASPLRPRLHSKPILPSKCRPENEAR